MTREQEEDLEVFGDEFLEIQSNKDCSNSMGKMDEFENAVFECKKKKK